MVSATADGRRVHPVAREGGGGAAIPAAVSNLQAGFFICQVAERIISCSERSEGCQDQDKAQPAKHVKPRHRIAL